MRVLVACEYSGRVRRAFAGRGHRAFSCDIPRLLQTVFYDLINEELWNIIKKHKNPRIDFAYLQRLTITKVKEKRKDIFNG